MTLIIPDPRWEEPNLLIPGRKPVGPVTIDWSHPLAQGLTVCILFQSPEPRNLVDGAALTKSGGAYFTPDGQYFDEVDDYYTLPNVTITDKHSLLTHPNFTDNTGSFFQYFINWGTVNTDTTINVYLIESSAGTNPDALIYNNGTGGNSTFKAASYWSGLDDLPVAATVSPTNSPAVIRLWVGDIEKTNSSSGINTWTVTSATRTLYIGARNDLNADRLFGGTLRYLYIYGARVLSPVEVVSLQRDPYQFLIPA